jgi:hypothetical protein
LELFKCGISPLIICDFSSNHEGEIPHPTPCQTEWSKWRLRGVKTMSTKLEICNVTWLHRYFDRNQLRHISVAVVKLSSMRLVNSLHKISKLTPQNQPSLFYKAAPIFTTFTHNTSIDSLSYHLCCDLPKVAISHETKKCGFSRRSNCPVVTTYLSAGMRRLIRFSYLRMFRGNRLFQSSGWCWWRM